MFPFNVVWIILLVVTIGSLIGLLVWYKCYKWLLANTVLAIIMITSFVITFVYYSDNMNDDLTNCMNNFNIVPCRLVDASMWIYQLIILILLFVGLNIPHITNDTCFTNIYNLKTIYKLRKMHKQYVSCCLYGIILSIVLLLEYFTKHILFITEVLGIIHLIVWTSFYGIPNTHADSLDKFWVWSVFIYITLVYKEFKNYRNISWRFINVLLCITNAFVYIISLEQYTSIGYYYLTLMYPIQCLWSFWYYITHDSINDYNHNNHNNNNHNNNNYKSPKKSEIVTSFITDTQKLRHTLSETINQHNDNNNNHNNHNIVTTNDDYQNVPINHNTVYILEIENTKTSSSTLEDEGMLRQYDDIELEEPIHIDNKLSLKDKEEEEEEHKELSEEFKVHFKPPNEDMP